MGDAKEVEAIIGRRVMRGKVFLSYTDLGLLPNLIFLSVLKRKNIE